MRQHIKAMLIMERSDSIKHLRRILLFLIISVSVLSIVSNEKRSPDHLAAGKKSESKAVESEIRYSKQKAKPIEKYKTFKYPELGCSLELSEGMTVDNSCISAFLRAYDSDLDLKISRETSPYDDMDSYFRQYIYKYILNPEYRNANKIGLLADEYWNINGFRTKIVAFSRTPAPGSSEKQNQYFHALIMTGGREFYSCQIRCTSISSQREKIQHILKSFSKMAREPEAAYKPDFKPVLPAWNSETRDYYNRLKSSDKILWGIFIPNSITDDFSEIKAMEEKLQYDFPIVLHYIYLGQDFPAAAMINSHRRRKTVELTMQIMWNVKPGNTDSKLKNLNFGVLDGLYDDEIRRFARQAKAFGHPFLFRLNNEMNSTWIRYSGIALLCDPDIYIKVWRRVYDIFEEEGVDNAIWVFNPNDIDYPPLNWNSHVSYYPGNKYVHMIGLTGYNTGTYYQKVTGERWRSFTEIYEPLNNKYSLFYSRFPWMITEFACSSVGGDKEQWIREMFNNIGRYKNIKAAVWWSYADFDQGEKTKGTPARRYWLDERPEYLKAFREGIRSSRHTR